RQGVPPHHSHRSSAVGLPGGGLRCGGADRQDHDGWGAEFGRRSQGRAESGGGEDRPGVCQAMTLGWRKKEARAGWLFTAPALIHLLVFALFPIAAAFGISLYKWQLFKDNATFVAFRNYLYAFTEHDFWRAMLNSLTYALFAVPLGMIAALAVALLV